MHKPLSAARREFDPAEAYQYPEHLRPFIVDLPSSPGVYVFHSDSDVMPLYVGKSVNIRSRVMSHLRTAEEARMLRQAHRISFHRTAGEIGALLLEAQMIKQLQPLHNKRLRRNRQLCSIQVVQGVPSIVSAKEIDFARTPDLYGLYSSRRTAQQSLLAIGDSEQLCYSLLGLERVSHGRPCFRHHLGRCAGACCGRESREEHHLRLMDALGQMRIFCWPFSGPVGLVETDGDRRQIHVVDNWFYLGSVETLAQAAGLRTVSPSFDSDGYKILCGPIMSGRHGIIELT
ncbi:excinuclease Cho [Sodalis praecaptivus]|uniref:excinuclease Cho n=1 Tax=Sodalis praecaptivus TaxID=1239307 RepID=UPI0027EE66D4|nr:excinuclease Cho [Sodalis praecaptivus]CAJ0996919.1 Excinuclease cho [Sodalis praecaptivus]